MLKHNVLLLLLLLLLLFLFFIFLLSDSNKAAESIENRLTNRRKPC